MRIYEARPGLYTFRHLPQFAKFVLDEHLEEFVREQINLSRELKLPLLKYLSHLSDEQLVQTSINTTAEYLTYLSENKAKEQLQTSFQRWWRDQLRIVGKYDISAEDITVLNYIRQSVLKKLLRLYDVSSDTRLDLIDEIDRLYFGATTSAFNTYMDMLKGEIENESFLNKQLIDTSPGIIFIFDLIEKKEIYVNGNVKQLMGFTPQEVIDLGGRILSELTHPEDVEIITSGFKDILDDTTGRTHVLEYRFRHKDGTYRWLRSYMRILKRDENGKPLELLGTSFEVTREKETAQALQKREEQLLEAQSITKIGSFEWNLINDTSVNTPELEKVMEIDGHQRNEDFMQNVHPDDRERVRTEMAAAYESGYYDCQYRYVVNGREKHLWSRGRMIKKDGQPTILRGTVQDITELKNIENALMKKTEELQRSNESLQQFASIASHDLKEPLRKMSMYTDMVLTVEDAALTGSSKANLEKVKSSSIRMQQMIEDILDFSSLTNVATKEEVDLKEVVGAAQEILRDSIQEKQAIITCDDLPMAAVIPSQMRQLFQNLITNALKFSKPNVQPRIHISHQYIGTSEPTSRLLEIRVQDNGIGFKQEYAERIFGLFTRLHSRSSYEGSGLGLSICKRIVENHNGTIAAVSEPDKGATFILCFPA